MSAGLKDLSLKVMEQVIKEGKTTYGQVATQLIHILKHNTSLLSSYFDADDDSHSESPKGNATPGVFEKREKNIRRRVYDALNVQFAAGVLVKEGKKYIRPNYNCKEFKRIYASILAEKPLCSQNNTYSQ